MNHTVIEKSGSFKLTWTTVQAFMLELHEPIVFFYKLNFTIAKQVQKMRKKLDIDGIWNELTSIEKEKFW